jgi:hypothetical protein
MSESHSKGYVGLFEAPLRHSDVEDFIEQWLQSYSPIEQVAPTAMADNATIKIEKKEDLLVTPNMQFRISLDENFVWVYLTTGRYVIETTGFLDPNNTMPYEVLLDLPGIQEIIEDTNDKRLDQLEAEGLM